MVEYIQKRSLLKGGTAMTNRSFSKNAPLLAVLVFLLIAVLTSCGHTSDTSTLRDPEGSSTVENGTTTAKPIDSNVPTVTTDPTVTSKPTDTIKPADTSEPPVTAEKPTEKDPAMFDGVMIHSVYGTGKKAVEAVIPFGYIQLYNESGRDVLI